METAIVLDTPELIAGARLLTLRSGLKLEIQGMKRRGSSCLSIIKYEFGLKGSKVKVLGKFETILKGKGILQ